MFQKCSKIRDVWPKLQGFWTNWKKNQSTEIQRFQKFPKFRKLPHIPSIRALLRRRNSGQAVPTLGVVFFILSWFKFVPYLLLTSTRNTISTQFSSFPNQICYRKHTFWHSHEIYRKHTFWQKSAYRKHTFWHSHEKVKKHLFKFLIQKLLSAKVPHIPSPISKKIKNIV